MTTFVFGLLLVLCFVLLGNRCYVENRYRHVSVVLFVSLGPEGGRSLVLCLIGGLRPTTSTSTLVLVYCMLLEYWTSSTYLVLEYYLASTVERDYDFVRSDTVVV